MSDGHDHDAHEGAADAHHDHGFDGEPARELGPGEPMTPGWVPAVGGALFVGLATFGLLASHDEGAAAPAPPSSQTAAAEAAPPPRAVQLPSTMRPSRPDLPTPGQGAAGAKPPADGAGSPPIKRLSPQEIQEVQRRINEKMQQQKGEK